MKIKILQPNNCTEKEINDFFELVKYGGQVNIGTLLIRLKKAKLLALGYVDDKLIAVTSLKIPNDNYKKRVFENGNIMEKANFYSYELGYAVTHEKYRGKGYNFKLNYELISKVNEGNIYAITGNTYMIKLLIKLGFKAIGAKYKGYYNESLQIYSLSIMHSS
jgi:predicted GNAT family N-acyltransferase